MSQYLPDSEVFGQQSNGPSYIDSADIFGGAPAKKENTQGVVDKTVDVAESVNSAVGQGIGSTQAGIGQFIQAPIANTAAIVAGASALADRGITGLINKVSPGSAELSPNTQDQARRMSEWAAQSRAENVANGNVVARMGASIQDDGRRIVKENQEYDKANNPTLTNQQQAVANAEGFVDNVKAAVDNPLATTHSLIKSLPDMLIGMGVARTAATRVMGEAAGAAEAAAARAAAGGADKAAQTAAAELAVKEVQERAVSAASRAGVTSEAASSAMQGREGVYQAVSQIPDAQLQKSPRYQEILAKTGDAAAARIQLANELADQVPGLTALGTAAGSLIANKLFGGDATAKTVAGVDKMTAREFGKRVAGDTVEEGLQGIPEDAVQYGAEVQADVDKKYDPAGSLAQNMVASFAMGGGGHGASYIKDNAPAIQNTYKAFMEGRDKAGDPVADQPGQAPTIRANAVTRPDTGDMIATGKAGEPSEAEKALTAAPKSLTSLDRVGEIDDEIKRANTRLAELNTGTDYGPMFDGERAEVAAKAKELTQEREAITKTWPKAVPGSETSFSTEAGARVNASYALIEAGDLITSHDENLRKNPAYPQELQPRERDRAASELQVSGIVHKLDPARLGLSADAANGAPIVGADGLVESGNARTIAMKRVYQANGQKAEGYKQFLRDNAEQFGITPESVDAMKSPMLVRVRTSQVNRAEFARQANASTVAQMSPSEQAKSDANRIDVMDDLTPDDAGDFSNAASMPFIRRFLGKLPVTEQAGMIDADGKLSTAGYTRVRNAVLAKAYGDSPVLMRMVESMDDNLRNVSKALLTAAPKVAQMRDAVKQGVRFDSDITPDLMAAVEELSRLKDSGTSITDALAQAGMFGDKYSQETRDLLQFLADNIRRPRRMADFIVAYMDALDSAGDPNQGTMFDEPTAPAKQDLIKAAKAAISGVDDGITAQDAQRGDAGENTQPGAQAGGEPANAKSNQGGNEGSGYARPAAGGQEVSDDWVEFPKDSGTLGIPRVEMPQVKSTDRGALIQFLKGKGIEYANEEVAADTLKPTQAEYAKSKIAKHFEVHTGERSVLVSSDGHVLDGHHQWMAALATGEPVKVIRFDAPIRKLLDAVYEFPGTRTGEGSGTDGKRAKAVADFKDAMGELVMLATKHTRMNMIPPNDPKVLAVLAKLFDAAIEVVGTDMKRAVAYVKEQLKKDPDLKTFWNKISNDMYQRAALDAVERMDNKGTLFADHIEDVRAMVKPKVAMIDGKAYDINRDNFTPPETTSFIPADVLANARDQIRKLRKAAAPIEVSNEDRARAEKLLKPLIEKANEAKVEYDQKIIDIAKRTGALGQSLASVKSLSRAVEKLATDKTVGFDVGKMYDMLRSTIVVSSYDDAQAVLDAIREDFEVLPGRIKNMTDAKIDGKAGKFLDSGYGQVLINVRAANGTISEIQINVPHMLAVKGAEGHKLYDIERSEPEGSETKAASIAAQKELNQLALAASKNVASEILDQRMGQNSSATSPVQGDFSSKKKMDSSGNLTYKRSTPSPSDKSIPNSQPAGNLSGTFIEKPFEKSVPKVAPESKTPTVDGHKKVMDAAHDGSVNLDEFKASFNLLVNSEEAVKAELTTLTKDKLLAGMSGFMQTRYRTEKKDTIVKAVYRDMLSDYALGQGFSYGMGNGSYLNAVRNLVEAVDADKLKAFSEERAQALTELKARRDANAKAIEDPQSLNDFRLLMRASIEGGMTRQEAFLALTPEQRVTYDALDAESTREDREKRKRAAKTEVRAAGQSTGGDIIATKHTRDGYDLFVVRLSDRVSREDYATLLSSAKRMGGWYSSFRGNGATPGFQFKDKANAEAFLKLAAGDTTDAMAQAEQRRDAFADDRSQTGVERLTEMADRLEADADEAMGQDRKVNTERRARFASAAEAAARENKALANTMRNIAKSIEDGTAKFLDAVRQKTQVQMLSAIVRTAKDVELRTKYPEYVDYEKRKGEPATAVTADFAEFPSFTAYRSDLASLGRQLLEVDGTKKLGQKIMAVADDVSDAYFEFAKENLLKVSSFGAAGKLAEFNSKDGAERAIVRSGLVGKAIVLPVKRGINRVILSPSEAMNRGVWTGDGDKRITLSRDFGQELVQAIGRRANKTNRLSVPWQFESASDKLKALSRMGIETAPEYRSALREFIGMQERAQEADKVKMLERSMVGRKKDGLDFFPTPEETADAMVAAAEITPDMAVLEPSAGMGHLADRIRAAGAEPDVVEMSGERRDLLEAKGFNVVGDDFMAIKPREFFTFGDVFEAKDGTRGVMRGLGGMGSHRVRLVEDSGRETYHNRDTLQGVEKLGSESGYDRIVMNPPFSGRRDAEHVMHAYDLLKPGGRLISLMGEGVFFGSDKKAEAFREWLSEHGGTDEKLADGTFLDPSLPVTTGVNARMVVIDKPLGDSALSRGAEAKKPTPTDTPAFKRWFGDSKVVDADGKPLTVYHGSPDIRGIIKSGFKPSISRGDVFFFTGSQKVANTYADPKRAFDFQNAEDHILPLYLSMQNPMIVDANGKKWRDTEKFVQEAKDKGHDGIIIKNSRDEYNNTGNGGESSTVYAVFKPTQIKSAAEPGILKSRFDGRPIGDISNNGDFDPENPNISMSRTDATAKTGMDVRTLDKLAQRIKAKMPNMPKVNVLADPSEAPKKLRDYITEQGAWNDVEGAMHDGEFYLFASGLSDELRAEHVLAEHEAAHFGLRAILGPNLKNVMNHIYNNNADVRRAAKEFQKRGKLSNANAAEEIIVDIPTAELAKLKGWRKMVNAVREWLDAHGFNRTAAQIQKWLDGSLTAQEQADLFVAGLVNAAREHMRGTRPATFAAATGNTMLSGTLAEDIAKQEKWLTAEAKARGYKSIDDLVDTNYPLFEKLAKLWREKNPAENGVLLSRSKPTKEVFERRIDALFAGEKPNRVGVKVLDKSDVLDLLGFGRKPLALQEGSVSKAPNAHPRMTADQWKKVPDWIENPAAVFDSDTDGGLVFIGPEDVNGAPVRIIVEPDGRGGDKLTVSLLVNAYDAPGKAPYMRWISSGMMRYADAKKFPAIFTQSVGRQLPNTVFQNKPGTTKILTEKNLAGYKKEQDPTPDIRLSRRDPAETAHARAEALIQKRVSTVSPLNAIAMATTRLTGINRLAGAIYDRAGFILDRYTPENVKAGLISDYGVPEAVIDQRAMLQGRQRVQLRKAGQLIDKLSTLTRAESQVAYEWMNMDGSDPQGYMSMMQGLPEESVKVLLDVQKMIDALSKEAVALGQLPAEVYERNKFAYLRRSYAKHTLEMTTGEKKARAKAITLLGDQYKGRGLSEEATVSQIKEAAPDWWGRKTVDGQADTALKGAKFVRLELRTAKQGDVQVRRYKNGNTKVLAGTKDLMVDTKSGALDGMDAANSKTKLREVSYIPVGESIPAQYAEWDRAGTFEVRTVKGDKLVLWRDFTKEEREKMGEIDEARFAIAKTLHGMIQDVEVGRYLEWLGQKYAKPAGSTITGKLVEASERFRDTFAPDEWVQVPDTKIDGTSVAKYGKLAGKYLPGPVWNDLRQTVNGQFKPLGEVYNKIQGLWKTSKTALSPGVHMNNVMSNLVMADWHDVSAGHITKALRIMLAANQRDGKGAIGAVGNKLSGAGIADREAALEVFNRYKDSGGDIGSWATQEIAKDQIEPLLASIEQELAITGGASQDAQVGAMAALQHLVMMRFPSAWDAVKGTKTVQAVGTEAKNMLDLYQAEDDVFRLAAWLKAKEDGKSDMDAGKVARKSFLDYHINAPWINAMKNTGWPFISYTYRAVPMLLEVMGKRPHKLLKLMAFAGALNALGVLLAGGDDDEERKLLPEEKAGRIWGLVPKLIRMPWNDSNGSAVYLDIRRFIPVGDVFDVGAGHSAVPMLPGMMPGGPLALMGEIVLNKSAFTGKEITKETDTTTQKVAKMADYLWKAFVPNILGLPGTYATTATVDAISGRTDAFGREQSVAQAMASSVGVKLGSYPKDVMTMNLVAKMNGELGEIDANIGKLKRQLLTHQIDRAKFDQLAAVEVDKKKQIVEEFRAKTGR